MFPFLSVVVPVYNNALQLSRCIDSILGQDYHDYELILVNDGSTDQSPKLCNRYATEHPHISVIHKENGGAAEARNTGLKAARGRYIYFIDSDDWINENTLAKLGQTAAKTEADLIVFGYSKKMISDRDVYLVHSDLPGTHVQSGDEVRKALCPLLDRGIRFSIWNKFFKRSLVEEKNITFPSFKRGQDMAFTMMYFKYMESILIRPDRVYNHEYSYNPEKFTPEVFLNHLELFETFYHLYPGWMDKERNYRYAARLFGFWFFIQIPKIIISRNSKKKALEKIRGVIQHKSIRYYAGYFKSKKLKSMKTRFPIFIIHNGNYRILYVINLVWIRFERVFKKYL